MNTTWITLISDKDWIFYFLLFGAVNLTRIVTILYSPSTSSIKLIVFYVSDQNNNHIIIASVKLLLSYNFFID